jgi:hypothetical protein
MRPTEKWLRPNPVTNPENIFIDCQSKTLHSAGTLTEIRFFLPLMVLIARESEPLPSARPPPTAAAIPGSAAVSR